MFFSVIFCCLFFTTAQSGKILGVFLFPAFSHYRVFYQICRELSHRGHQVTVLTPLPVNDHNLQNLTEVPTTFRKELAKYIPKNFLSKKHSMFQEVHKMRSHADNIFQNGVNNSQFKKFLQDQTQDFDLILLECKHASLYSLSVKFKAPIICVSSLGALVLGHDVVGNPTHPILQREFFVNQQQKVVSLWTRTQFVLLNVWSRIWYRFIAKGREEKSGEGIFRLGVPNHDLEKNVAMMFLTVNTFLYPVRANVPALIEMEMVSIEPVGILPQDLQEFLDGNEEVIYFSLGTLIQIEDSDLGQNIIESILRLPFKVLIKWKCDNLKMSKNILCKEWFPQQDVLAHPNVKVFVSHGGLQSVEQAIFSKVPIVGLPFFLDQHMNTQRVSELGIGIALDPEEVTPVTMTTSIVKILSNSEYKKKIQEIADILKDRRAVTGLEKAVWWSEYVIRHKGALHLKSPTVDFSWFYFLMLDVVGSAFLVMTALIFFIYILFRIIKRVVY